jgi:hypothetical protein
VCSWNRHFLLCSSQNSDKIRVQTHNTNAVSQNLKSCALETLRCRVNLARGRAHVRHVLHMAAMSASNWNPALKVFHDRLKIAANCRRCLESPSDSEVRLTE